jgi:N-acetylmuramoyl-L-alanine amidase
MWRIVVLVMLLIAGSVTPVVAQGKPGVGNNGGGPGSGGICPTGTADVVLDPGHGGGDPGAVNSGYDLLEKNVNLDIAFQTMMILERNGYTVALTRYDNDTALGNSERGAIANACGASVFVEIHLNGSTDPSVNFTSNFYGKKNKDLAFSQTMNEALSSLGITNNGVGQFANGGLLHADMPSTLVEAVFLTSAAEAEKLSDGTGVRQNQIAQAIADGVVAQIGG